MLPEVWGKHLWYSIHYIALDYPQRPSQEDALAYKHFFENLWRVIPCYKCGQNYQKHLQELPLDANALSSRDALFAWTVALHNIVNRDLGKPQVALEDARRMYANRMYAANGMDADGDAGGVNKLGAFAKDRVMGGETAERNNVNVLLAFVLGALFGVMVWWVVKEVRRGRR